MQRIRTYLFFVCMVGGLAMNAQAQAVKPSPPKPAAKPAAQPSAPKPVAKPAAQPSAKQPVTAVAKPLPAPPVEPFTGTIGFGLVYSGGYAQEALAALPDSMTMYVVPPVIRVRYHGGLSDSLGTELHWDAAQHRFLMIDRISETAWTIDEPHALLPKPPFKAVAKDTVAGMKCKVFEIAVEGGKDRYSICDSIRFPFVLANDSLRDSLVHFVPPFLLAGQEGLPLRVIRSTAAGTVRATAITVTRGGVDPAALRMPSGYTVTPFDPRPKRHPYLKGKEDR
jgi:hypothetical protein